MNPIQALLLMGYIVIALVWLWLDRKEVARIDRIGAHYRREHRIMRRNDRIKEIRP